MAVINSTQFLPFSGNMIDGLIFEKTNIKIFNFLNFFYDFRFFLVNALMTFLVVFYKPAGRWKYTIVLGSCKKYRL